MTRPESGLVLVVGLPESGKSTFLAALLHCVTANQIDSRLHLPRYVGEFADLRELERRWLACEPIGRTLKADESRSVLPLRHDASGRDYELIFPDLSGDQFDVHWGARECSKDYAELAKDCNGVILLINPENIAETPALEDLPGVTTVNENGETDAPSQVMEWNADETSTQVKLVDLLQTLLHLKDTHGEVRLSIVVSLWDTVADRGEAPAEVVRLRLPLLYQFVAASHQFCSRYFGVSAQGGNYETDREKLVKLKPADRITVVGSNGDRRDLTLPIVWALSVDSTND